MQRGSGWPLTGMWRICKAGQIMRIAVRLDDITPDMDWERFFKFKALLDRYQVKPLIGVVPDNRDENLKKKDGSCKKQEKKAGSFQTPADFWAFVRELKEQGWVAAMHGCYHVYTTDKGGLFPLNNFSEFAGVPFERQREMLEEGKRILKEKGIETDIFMAPAHSYDVHTLKALKETGFAALTDGFGSMPYSWMGLKFYPISFRLESTFQKTEGFSTMVVHTDTLSDKDLERYENYFKNPKAEWIDYKEYLRQPVKSRSFWGREKEFLMAKGKFLLVRAGQMRRKER